MANARKLFVNLPVRDLARSMAFFTQLGFEFNPKFTDDKAACMVLSDDGYVMLLSEPFFASFTARPLSDRATTGAICSFSCASRAEVDTLGERALAIGGARAKEPIDHGFMYGRSFYDVDGHHWELFWMDPAAAR